MYKYKSRLGKYLDWIERAGNKLPDPMMLFVYMSIFIVVLSAVLGACGVYATNPVTGDAIYVKNLFSRWGLGYLFSNAVTNFVNYAPLGYVLIALIGSTVAEKSDFFPSLLQKIIPKSKGWIVTAILIFICLNASVGSDASIVILPPLAAIIYMSIGRRPVLGCYIAFGSVAAGYSASCLVSSLDTVLASITQDAARIIDPTVNIAPTCNLYFMICSTVLLTIGGTVLVEKYLIKRFQASEEQIAKYNKYLETITVKNDTKPMIYACISILVIAVLLLLLCIPFGQKPALLADSDGKLFSSAAPFSKGIVLFIAAIFFVPGVVYGICTGRYKSAKDVRLDIEQGFAEMGGYVFICFVISVFVNFFAQSNIGVILSIKGADWLRDVGFTGIPLIFCILLLCAFINLFMGSATAKWTILAQIFVPMLMLLGFSPAMTQVVYRIGDSITNPLSPLFPYVPILLGTLNKVYKDAGMGTIIANMLPISITYGLIWTLQLIVWIVLGLPFGPGA